MSRLIPLFQGLFKVEFRRLYTAAQVVLESFGRLSAGEKREVVDEILLRTRDLEWPPIDDETIDRIADESFLEYDLREEADGNS